MDKNKVEAVAKVVSQEIVESDDNKIGIAEIYAYKFKMLKLNVAARKKIAKELTVEERDALRWQTVGDIFSFIDTSTLAKENPKEAAKILKLVAGILGAIFPIISPISVVILALPTKKAASLVEWLGKPTPEHVIHELAKRKSKKAKEIPLDENIEMPTIEDKD